MESNLVKFAKEEARLLNVTLDEEVLELLTVFSNQGHSGASAAHVIAQFYNLARFKPLAPLTGNDNEWILISEDSNGKLYQNKRCYSVFKLNDKAYNIDATYFKEKETGICYSNYDCRRPVEFPYTIPEPIEILI